MTADSHAAADVSALVSRVTAGDVRAAARACRWVDDRAAGARELLRALYPKSRGAWLIGVTGAPGAGKSTLTSALVSQSRAEGKRVGIVAVDPSSPFSGGAILGDRIRMQEHFEDAGVFIRSVATRGALGGLSQSAADVSVVLAAWGADLVFLETVGVGQDELEVAFVADTTLVVVAPGLGDDIQALKAGILECADIFAVNKADLSGADAVVRDLELMLALAAESGGSNASGLAHGHGALGGREAPQASRGASWRPPIVRTCAARGQGIGELYAAMCRHRRETELAPELVAQRYQQRLLNRMRGEFSERLVGLLGDALAASAARCSAGLSDPYTECEELWEVLKGVSLERA